VDDQRFTHGTGSRDMSPEACLLAVMIAFAPVVIQTGFSKGNHPGPSRQLDQFFHGRIMSTGFIGMHADRHRNLIVGFDQIVQGRITLHVNGDTKLMDDTLGGGFGHQLAKITPKGAQIQSVEMAVGIYQHRITRI
jgi:hypothetical protein